MSGLLEGKVAIVTGAGRGLGRAEAERLAAEGAAVVVNDPGVSLSGEPGDEAPADEVVSAIRAAGGRAVASKVDCADWNGAETLFRTALDEFGGVDILVNNAGILRERMIFNMAPEEWDAVVRVHLTGHVATTRLVAKYWRDRFKETGVGGGRIINTTSEAGLLGSLGQANYVAAKAGIAALTMALARELAPYGVTVNAISPRAATRMTDGLTGMPIPKEELDILMSKVMDPVDIAAVVAYLASDAAAHISGQVLLTWGGRVELAETWHVVASALAPVPWEVDEVGKAIESLFSDRPSVLPPLEP